MQQEFVPTVGTFLEFYWALTGRKTPIYLLSVFLARVKTEGKRGEGLYQSIRMCFGQVINSVLKGN